MYACKCQSQYPISSQFDRMNPKLNRSGKERLDILGREQIDMKRGFEMLLLPTTQRKEYQSCNHQIVVKALGQCDL